VRVLVADNSRIHTRLLAEALKRDPQLEAIPFESDSSGLVEAAASQRVDVLVVSSNLDEMSSRGLEIVHELRSVRTQTKSVVLLASSKDEFILSAFRSGARGLFTKNDALELLGECVLAVHSGKIWANHHAMAVAVEAIASGPVVRAASSNAMHLLSKRELQVVWALAEGLTNREIADQLGLSPHTIKNYLFRIFDKLGVSSRIELLFMALSQPAPGVGNDPKSDSGKITSSDKDLALTETSARAGIPSAQLALAQLCFAKGRDAKDLVEAYMWFLVATERASTAGQQITKLLTPEQITEAKNEAYLQLSRLGTDSPGLVKPVSPSPLLEKLRESDSGPS